MSVKEVLASAAAQKFKSPNPSNELNWKSSLSFCSTLADAINKYGKEDLPSKFTAIVEPYLNNILECALSERTQLSVQGCRLLMELPKALGSDIHMLLDRILPALIKHCASTKTVNQKSGSAAVTSIVENSAYSPRLLWHITQAFEDKNTGPRLYAPGWLKLMLDMYHRHLHSDRDFDAISKAVTLGLLDADSTVRTNSRALFWAYYRLDNAAAQEIKSKLNSHAITALDNDPNNPDKKSTKAKPKKAAEPDPALAALRQQRKKAMQEKMAELKDSNALSTTEPIGFTADQIEVNEPKQDLRLKKSSRDLAAARARQNASSPQPDAVHLSKSAVRPHAVHKKVLSQDMPAPNLSKKPSTVEMSKKPSSADALRTSQTKKAAAPTPAADTQSSRGLLSGPVRRPRIIATPINPQQPSSRPSSRLGSSHGNNQNSDSNSRSTKEPAVSYAPEAREQSQALPLHTKAERMGPNSSSSHSTSSSIEQVTHPDYPPQPKMHKRYPQEEATLPIPMPDGKENATAFAPPKKLDRQPSPIRKPLQVPQQAQQTAASQRDFSQTNTDVSDDIHTKDARRALGTAIQLLKSDQMDYMGFRKLKKLICNFGQEVINEKSQYDVIMQELLPRLGSIEELVDRGDPSDDRHPTYIRQSVVHIMLSLLQEPYSHSWSDEYMGAGLAALLLARCYFTPYSAEVTGTAANTAVFHRSSTLDLIDSAKNQIIAISKKPLDLLDAVLDAVAAGESYIVEHAEEIPASGDSTYPSFNYYSQQKQKAATSSPHRDFTPTSDDPQQPIPNKMPQLMAAALDIIISLLQKARRDRINLYPGQETMLGELAQHLLTTYNALIGPKVMTFCQQLFLCFSSEEEFWQHFPAASDRNLVQYYLAKSSVKR